MAKKARKKTDIVQGVQSPASSFDEMYPTIARWISQEEGWIELGADHYSRSLARALYGGGMAWEGTDDYESLDEALRALEEGIASWLEETRPDSGRGGSLEKKSSAASPEKPKPAKKTPPKSPPPKRDARDKPEAAPPVPRAIADKIRKFSEIAEGLRRGQRYEITRLTTLKGLCKDLRAARSFATFLAVQARKWAEEKKATDRIKGLMDKSITEVESYLDDPTKERKDRLYDRLREIEGEQNEHKRISWNMVRIIHSNELLVVENALRSILREHEAPTWLYQAARDYAEWYDPRHGTGLIPASAPMMQDISDFWGDFFGIGR
jgi:hypothetical protein